MIVWDLLSGTALFTLSGHTYDINTVTFSPDGQTLASGCEVRPCPSRPKNTRFITAVQRKCSFTLRRRFPRAQDETLKLWSVASGAELRTIPVHSSVTCIQFSPDGLTIAASCYVRSPALCSRGASFVEGRLTGALPVPRRTTRCRSGTRSAAQR